MKTLDVPGILTAASVTFIATTVAAETVPVELVVVTARRPTYEFSYATPTGEYDFSISVQRGVGTGSFDAVKFFKNLKYATSLCRKPAESCADWGARIVSPGIRVNVDGRLTDLGGRGVCSLAGTMASPCVIAIGDLTTGMSAQSSAFCESVKCPDI